MYEVGYRILAQQNPRTALASCWIIWKLILTFLALGSPGIGYDTSTDVVFATPDKRASLLIYGLKKLLRWDAVYFSQIAQRGPLFEQEWAFGWGFTRMLGLGGKGRSWSKTVVTLLTMKPSPTSTMVRLALPRLWSEFSSLTFHTCYLSSYYSIFREIFAPWKGKTNARSSHFWPRYYISFHPLDWFYRRHMPRVRSHCLTSLGSTSISKGISTNPRTASRMTACSWPPVLFLELQQRSAVMAFWADWFSLMMLHWSHGELCALEICLITCVVFASR